MMYVYVYVCVCVCVCVCSLRDYRQVHLSRPPFSLDMHGRVLFCSCSPCVIINFVYWSGNVPNKECKVALLFNYWGGLRPTSYCAAAPQMVITHTNQ